MINKQDEQGYLEGNIKLHDTAEIKNKVICVIREDNRVYCGFSIKLWK
jgi:hypothetical protein